MRVVKIPRERVGVLIGTNGTTLEKIHELTSADIRVEEGSVEIEADDPLEELRVSNIIKAIGRGFAPEKAYRLLEENSAIAVIDVTNFGTGGGSKERLKGRVIGRDGEAKTHVENATDTEIAVYGKTVSILGPMAGVEIAKKAVEMLLSGKSHATAYRYLKQSQAKLLNR